ncbi:MAG: hypothetical protein V8S37_10570 [Lachnospiraceae bacterium]
MLSRLSLIAAFPLGGARCRQPSAGAALVSAAPLTILRYLSNAVTRSRNTEQGEAPDADQPQREAAFVGVYGSIAGNFGVPDGQPRSPSDSLYVWSQGSGVSEDLNGECRYERQQGSYDTRDISDADGLIYRKRSCLRVSGMRQKRVHTALSMIPADRERYDPDPEPPITVTTAGQGAGDIPADGTGMDVWTDPREYYYIVKPVSNGEDSPEQNFYRPGGTQDGYSRTGCVAEREQ